MSNGPNDVLAYAESTSWAQENSRFFFPVTKEKKDWFFALHLLTFHFYMFEFVFAEKNESAFYDEY